MEETITELIREVETLKKKVAFLESSVSEIKENTDQSTGIWGNFSKYLKQSMILVYKDEKMPEVFEQVMKSLIDEQVLHLKDYAFEEYKSVELVLFFSNATRGDYVFIDSGCFDISKDFEDMLCTAITQNKATIESSSDDRKWEMQLPKVNYIICTENPENVPEILREKLPMISI